MPVHTYIHTHIQITYLIIGQSVASAAAKLLFLAPVLISQMTKLCG